MTSGERMVWAMAYVRAEFEQGLKPTEAARCAAGAVERMRDVRSDAEMYEELDRDERAMLNDMLSAGADR